MIVASNIMKTVIQTIIWYSVLILTINTLASCNSHCDCEKMDKNVKDGEVLYKICKYIENNKLTSKPTNPCDFKVREIKDDTLNSKQIYRVILTCCYMGDEAIIDKKTNKVIGYIPNDK